jgi:N-acetylmuramoyl-L-alanine amidase
MKLYLTAGHQIINGKGNGAFGVDNFDEAVEARILVQDIIRFMHYGNMVPMNLLLTDKDEMSLSSVIEWVGKLATRDCVTIDFHFNAFSKPSATGTEVLVADNATVIEIKKAERLSNIISTTLRTRNRGVKMEKDSARGKLGMLSSSRLAHAKNILLEICFITNPYDVKQYRDNYPELVKNLSNYLTEIL